MKNTFIIILTVLFLGLGSSGSSAVKPSSGIVTEIADLECEEAWEEILKALTKNKIPILAVDKKGGSITTGPVNTRPLKGDPYQKVEEQYRMEIKCLEPLVTHITCQIKVRGLTAGNTWVPIKESRYEKRFLDSLKLND